MRPAAARRCCRRGGRKRGPCGNSGSRNGPRRRRLSSNHPYWSVADLRSARIVVPTVLGGGSAVGRVAVGVSGHLRSCRCRGRREPGRFRGGRCGCGRVWPPHKAGRSGPRWQSCLRNDPSELHDSDAHGSESDGGDGQRPWAVSEALVEELDAQTQSHRDVASRCCSRSWAASSISLWRHSEAR
jgi:hypothetical protein